MPFPIIDACLLCDLVRPEALGKHSVLGYYGIAPYTQITIQNFAQPVGITFVFAGGPGDGHFRIDLRITAPNGAIFDAPGFEGDLTEQTTGTNIFVGFLGVLPGPGEYTATLLVDGARQFQTRFRLQQAPGQPVADRRINAPAGRPPVGRPN